MKDDDLLKEAREAWACALERDGDNRRAAEDDIRFARMEEQWADADRARREASGRPCLTINQLAPIIRQVVNDSRQNKPAIKVMPQDSIADPDTAEVMSGLIRNIEASSDADIAYDTAVENAVSSGRGYGLATAYHETWRTMLPVKEVGDDAYFFDRYDPNGSNPQLAKALGNTMPGDGVRYAGRGYVQITGRGIYARLGARLGVPLEDDPDLAFEAPIAARILCVGMAEGLFTGKNLADYFGPGQCDPLDARQIVNGQDKAEQIAADFAAFRAAL